MANGDLEQGRAPNEEDHFQILLQRAESGKKGVNERPYICMIPRVLRDLSEKSFTPKVVSIGPLHKDDVNLQELEGLKNFCLHDLLPSEDLLKKCVETVKASMVKIRSYYDDGVKEKYKDDAQLANMMVLDGCFILEFCYKHLKLKEDKPTLSNNEDKSPFSNDLQNIYIAMDLILLENQIPFFVLQDIFNCTIISQKFDISLFNCLLRKVLGDYIHPFYHSSDDKNFLEKFSVDDVSKDHSADTAHILDCLHKCYRLPDSGESRAKKEEETADHSVVELERSGVNFKHHQQKEKQGMTMIFERSPFPCLYGWSWSKPSLLMPKLVIEDFTEVVLRNFIAYEQSFPKVSYYFTSYACAMDKLIDNQADVGKLVESKVLVNNLGSNKEAADMINSICKNINLVDFYYPQVIRDLDEYYNGTWPNYIATLRRTYFNSPWSFIALLAGIALFVLTVVQTIFSVMSYNP